MSKASSQFSLLLTCPTRFWCFPRHPSGIGWQSYSAESPLGLSNLYYIDPEDQEILHELRQVRMSLIEAIERCPEQQLESIWATDLGDRYWALVRSGIQKEAMTPTEEQKKHAGTKN